MEQGARMRALDLAAHIEGVDVLRVDDDRALAKLACESRENVAAARAPVGSLAEVPVDDREHRPAGVPVVFEQGERTRRASCAERVEALAREVTLQLVECLGVVLEDQDFGIGSHRRTATGDGTKVVRAFRSRWVAHPGLRLASACATALKLRAGSANPPGYAATSDTSVAPRRSVPSQSSTPLPGASRIPPTFAAIAWRMASSSAAGRSKQRACAGSPGGAAPSQ